MKQRPQTKILHRVEVCVFLRGNITKKLFNEWKLMIPEIIKGSTVSLSTQYNDNCDFCVVDDKCPVDEFLDWIKCGLPVFENWETDIRIVNSGWVTESIKQGKIVNFVPYELNTLLLGFTAGDDSKIDADQDGESSPSSIVSVACKEQKRGSICDWSKHYNDAAFYVRRHPADSKIANKGGDIGVGVESRDGSRYNRHFFLSGDHPQYHNSTKCIMTKVVQLSFSIVLFTFVTLFALVLVR